MERNNASVIAWLALVLAVIALGVIFYKNSNLQLAPTITPGTTVSGTLVDVASTLGGYIVYLDINGDGYYDKKVFMSKTLYEQFGDPDNNPPFELRMPKGTKVTFSDCTVLAGGGYRCESKQIGMSATEIASQAVI